MLKFFQVAQGCGNTWLHLMHSTISSSPLGRYHLKEKQVTFKIGQLKKFSVFQRAGVFGSKIRFFQVAQGCGDT